MTFEQEERIRALVNVMNFMCWLEQEDPTCLWGGVCIADALDGIRVLLKLGHHEFNMLKLVALGEHPVSRR